MFTQINLLPSPSTAEINFVEVAASSDAASRHGGSAECYMKIELVNV